MKIKIIKGFCLGAGRDVQPGDVVDVNDKEAAIHIQKLRAVKAEDKDVKAAQTKSKAEAKAAAEAEAESIAGKQNDGGEE